MSGLGLELLQNEPAPARAPTVGGDFEKALRSGGLGLRSQLSTLAGTALDTISPGSGAGRHAASAEDQAASQQAGLGLTSFDDVNGLRSGAHWLAGAVGQSLPYTAPALVTGLATGGAGFAPALLAGSAAATPAKVGELLQRQQADPANAGMTPGQHLRNAILPGAGAALAESIIPAVTGLRLLGKTGAPTLKQIAGRTAISAPAEGLGEGLGEASLQTGLRQMNPNTEYDWEAIKDNAIQGAALGGALGTVGAAGEVAHKYGGAVARAPGRAIDAAKALVPDNVKQRAGEALGAAKDAVSDAATAVKAKVDEFDAPTQLRDLYANGKGKYDGLMNKVADGQETADPAALAAAPDLKAQGMIFDEADKSVFERTKEWGTELLNDNLTPEKSAQVQAWMSNAADKASQQGIAAMKRAQDVVNDLGEKATSFYERVKPKLDDVPTAENLTNFASMLQGNIRQTAAGKAFEKSEFLAAAKVAKHAASQSEAALAARLVAHIGKQKWAELVATGGVKKSEDFSGPRAKIGQAVMGVLGQDHPAFAKPETINKLADGLRTYITDVASGKTFDSVDDFANMVALYDVLGDSTTRVLKAVQKAVGTPTKDEAAFFSTLDQIDAIGKGRQGVLETLRKNLRPELQGVVRMSELQLEADMLAKWMRSKTIEPGVQRTISEAELKFNDRQVKLALETRYGPKAGAVYAAVEKSVKAEQNMLDTYRDKTLDSDEHMGETDGEAAADSVMGGEDGQTYDGQRKGKFSDEFTKVVVHSRKNKDGVRVESLYLSPEVDKGGVNQKTGEAYLGAATARMETIKTRSPNATVTFVKASDMDPKNPLVIEKREGLKAAYEALSESDGFTGDETQDEYVERRMEEFGSIEATTSKNSTTITSGDLDKMRLDTKHYGKSPSRLEAADDVILDATKITEFMHAKLKDEYSATDDMGRPYRMARMFKEGVAAVQDYLGHSFAIPDTTQITRSKDGPTMAWGEARKLDMRTDADKRADADAALLETQRKNYKKATPIEKENLKRMADEAAKKKENRKNAELTREEPKAYTIDDPEAEAAARDAYIADLREQRAAVDTSTDAGKRLDANLLRQINEMESIRNTAGDQTLRQKVDPFGPTHDVMRGRNDPNAIIRTNADGSPRDDTVMGRRKPALSTDAKALSSIQVTREAVDEKTGKRMQIKQRADEAMADVDEQISSTEALLKCLQS